MISVIIPTLNCEDSLAHALAALVPAAAEGIVREVIVVDGGSTDATARVADAAGCDWLPVSGDRGKRMAAGAEQAKRGPWLMFLAADTVLETGWHHEVAAFIERAERAGQGDRSAAAFRLKLDAFGWGARLSELTAMLRSQALAMPYGNQGLLISRRFYKELGGHKPLPEMEDIDLVRRIGRSRLVFLRASAICSGRPEEPSMVTAFRRALARFCVAMLRLPPRVVLRLHG
ncbi:glycosyltransferase [Polymorphum gilvum]|uniref:Glycosyltransferase 2-like domain-containing protein n=1 Tax=Polymorphum gilvum (strain LMG 25793 / CGMCC 1.9160 / SL003B-26A1) TaxID=991905 RepID=F2IZ54_POLGS|nr:glycosyltransferase [Polymorphum gilvum]ADZ71777.1 hypothetical protein SL003B_3355 [Polymorphum gilvum SL003B-26A1]